MKKSLRIALVVVVLASTASILNAAPTNPWPVPVPQLKTVAFSAPTNPWPVPVPQSMRTLFSMFLSAFGL
ncbi:MAG TPA: hypothetical protein VGE85_03870 [Terracidiphilus sp.]|jgi:hypothetical protein